MSKRLFVIVLIIFVYLPQYVLASASESIQILSPSGGEKWPIGSTQNISWLYTPSITGDTFKVFIANDKGYSHSFNWIGDNGKAVYRWRILDWVDTNSNWRIEIHSLDEKYKAYSNFFSTTPKPKIEITAPKPAEIVLLGSKITVSWTVCGDNSNTKVLLYKGPTASLVKVLADNIATDSNGNGHFNWLVTGIEPGNDYWICVQSIDKPHIKDASGYFTVSSGKPTINTNPDDHTNNPNNDKYKIPNFEIKMP